MNDDSRDTAQAPEHEPTRRRPRRRAVLGLLGSAGLAAAGLAIAAATVTSQPNLPDMISEPPGEPATQIYWEPQQNDHRLLMRFDGWVTNHELAPAELEIYATTPNAQGAMQNVQQRVGGQVVDTGGRRPTVIFEVADGHRHYHLKSAAEYSLWTNDRARQVALAQKTEAGFCLEDSVYRGGGRPAKYSASTNDFCLQLTGGQTQPRPGPLVMGITQGWRDLYHAGLSYQWVDVSNVAPGRYQLANRADPTDVIAESDESNNGYAFREAVVPGFLPKAVNVGRVDPGQSAGITLAADEFISDCYGVAEDGDSPYCNPGTRRFRITSAPARGVLRQGGTVLAAGSELTSGAITYTASAGQRGGDSFTYEAYDAGEPRFPRTRPQAAVAIQVGAPITTVAISGAQPSIVAGLSMQLTAVTANAPSGVTWSASAGSITPSGLFTAPASAGPVAIRATSNDDPSAYAEVGVQVTAPQVQAPAPTVTPKPKPLIKRLKVGRVGKRIVVAKVTAGPKRGKVRITATLKKKVLGRCVRNVRAGKTATCKITLKRNYNLKRVKVTAKLTAGKTSAVRRSFVIAPKKRG